MYKEYLLEAIIVLRRNIIISYLKPYNCNTLYNSLCKSLALRMITWSYICLLRNIIISYLKPYNCSNIWWLINSVISRTLVEGLLPLCRDSIGLFCSHFPMRNALSEMQKKKITLDLNSGYRVHFLTSATGKKHIFLFNSPC